MSTLELPENQWVELATNVTSFKMTLVGVEDLHQVRMYKLASGTELPEVDTIDHDTVTMTDYENVPTSFNSDTTQNVYGMAIGHAGRVLV